MALLKPMIAWPPPNPLNPLLRPRLDDLWEPRLPAEDAPQELLTPVALVLNAPVDFCLAL